QPSGVPLQLLRIRLHQLRGRGRLPTAQHFPELHRVHYRLSPAVVVEDYVDEASPAIVGDLPGPGDPRSQLRGLVEVVVAGARVAPHAPPVPVVPAVHADVPDPGGALRAGLDRPREQRLVDVHEPHALLAQPRVEIGLVPALVADLDDEGGTPGTCPPGRQATRGSLPRS